MIPQKAIEAAAKAIWDATGHNPGDWIYMAPETERPQRYKAYAGAALEAAAPYLVREARAEIEELHEWQNTVANRMPEHYEDDIAQEAIIDRWLDDLTDGSLIREARATELEAAAHMFHYTSGVTNTLRERAAAIRDGRS